MNIKGLINYETSDIYYFKILIKTENVEPYV